MAVLSKIRQRSLLVISIVGLSLFAFIIGALIENGGFGTGSRNAGTINGSDISYEDFRIKVDNAQKSQPGMSMMQATNGVWEQEVRRVLLENQFEKLGLRLGDDQLISVIQDDPQFAQFKGPNGKFDKGRFNEMVSSFKQSPERWQQWLNYEKSLAQFATEQMYNSILKSGVYTTKAEGKFNYELENNKVTFDVVAVPYTTIDDKKVELTDDEVIAYMKKNEKKFKAEESRELEYVLVEDKASAADEKAIKDKINGLLSASVMYNEATGKNDTVAGFRNTTKIAEFVNANSDIKYDSTYIAKNELPIDHAQALYNSAPGSIYGPYVFGDYYCISKVIAKKAGINVKSSHVLVAYKGAMRSQSNITKEEAKAKADGILAQAQANPGSFAMLAFTSSDDTGSKQQGGDVGYITKDAGFAQKYKDFVFGNPVGKIGLVETEFGYHIINVTDKQDGIRLATIARKIVPSEATSNENFTKASQFEILANDKDFAQAAKESKLTVAPVAKVLALDENIQGVGPQREIVRWAFGASEGDVKRFETSAGHVVARLKKVNPKGLMPIADAKNMFGYKLLNEKKAKLIEAKMTGTTLEAVSKATGSPVKEAKDVVAANSYIETIGQEPKVVGTAFSLKPGTVSQTIAGNSGVFKIKVKSTAKAPAAKDYNDIVKRVASQSKGSLAGRVFNNLREDADIEDNRANFN
ncbi:peptidylprolyl isomerase [Flavobacterium sp. GCM10027622]|uniref:peptidylprolyl isomerase n=1 Tax=unclassified Flavobacterium TaxID=196869 RepID=UPI003606B330